MHTNCPVCGAESAYLDAIPLSVSCEDPVRCPGGEAVAYYLCPDCGFCHCPWMAARDKGWFLEHIYNDEYVKVDPEYVKDRPERQSKNLIYRYSYARKAIRHLDYGAGNGELVRRMAAAGFDSTPYDPFSHASRPEGVFNLISCFEVFEHVPDPQALMADLASLLSPQGVLLFSTLTSDGAISQGKPLDWWYAAPRNGHISLFSRESLARLAKQHGLHYQITQQGTHAFWKELPPWAAD